MDDKRFDNLTRAIAGTTTRRAVVGRLAGAVGGGLLAALGLRGAEARPCKPTGRPCRRDLDCCTRSCVFDVHRKNPPHGHCAAAATTTAAPTTSTSTTTETTTLAPTSTTSTTEGTTSTSTSTTTSFV